MDILKIEKICRLGRIALGFILIVIGFYTGNSWFFLGVIPLAIGVLNIKPFCIFTGKCKSEDTK